MGKAEIKKLVMKHCKPTSSYSFSSTDILIANTLQDVPQKKTSLG
jgi:hypothetical protein